MHKTVATLIGVVAMVAVLGCSSSVDKTDGTVFIFVSTIPTLPGSISVNDTAAGTGFLTINSLSIQSRAKDPNAVTSAPAERRATHLRGGLQPGRRRHPSADPAGARRFR